MEKKDINVTNDANYEIKVEETRMVRIETNDSKMIPLERKLRFQTRLVQLSREVPQEFIDWFNSLDVQE